MFKLSFAAVRALVALGALPHVQGSCVVGSAPPVFPFYNGDRTPNVFQMGRVPLGRGGGKTRAAVQRSRKLRGERK